MFRTTMIVIFTVCIFCSSVFAHNIWVEKKDGKFVVLYGHVDKNKFEPIEPAKVKETKGFDKNGKDLTVKIVQDKDRLSISPAKDLAAVTLLFDGGFVVKTTEGYKHISKREAKEYVESMQYIESIHSMEFSKTLFAWNSRFSEPLGMRFEIVPLKNPFDVKIGGPLPIKVLFGGKPFAGASIKVKGYGKETATELVANKEGIAEVVIEKPGVQIITASYKIPLKDNPDADFLSLSTAMTFEMK
jgi:nickel transport protein